MIAEPIQGVGGFITPPPEYFEIVKSILDDFEVPLIADEVQTGFGRTGEAFWGIESYGVTPDAIVVAKGLGNGVAIGGVVAKAEVVDSLRANHISTFGGSPITTRYAAANIDYIVANDLQGNAARMGKLLWQSLKPLQEQYAAVGEVRGKGLMIGIEIVDPTDGRRPDPARTVSVMEHAKQNGLLVGKGGRYGNVLRIAPPLTISEDDTAQAAELLTAAITANR
jgi:4-aminobutyrate aminotransferase